MSADPAKYKRAVMSLVEAHGQAQRKAPISIALAEALLRLSQRTEGAGERVKLLERALKADPYDARIRSQLGIARHRSGDFIGAMAALRAAAVLEPADSTITVNLALAMLARLRERSDKDLADKVIESFDAVLAEKTCTPLLARVAHAGKLMAAIHAPVVGPKPNRLNKLLPGALHAIEPHAEWLGLIGYLGAAMAFTAYFRKVQQKAARPEELTARKKMFEGLAGGMAPWFEAFPEDPRLGSVASMIAILTCDDSSLAATIAARGAALVDPRLLHLIVRQRLEDLDVAKRVEVLQATDELRPLSGGLDREFVNAMHHRARAAVCRGDFAAAAEFWGRAAARDPYNPALQHNLALLALSRRDAAGFGAHLHATVDLLLSYWLLRGGTGSELARLAAKHESFAIRLRKTIETSLTAKDGCVAPEVVGAWCGEMLASIVIRGVARALPEHRAPGALLEQLVSYLRSLPALCDTSIGPPPALADLIDPPIVGKAPLHYEILGVPTDAPPSAIQRRHTEALEALNQARLRARLEGNPEAAAQIDAEVAQLEAAFAVLSDIVKRKQYDGECIPLEEHKHHLARRRFVLDMRAFAQQLDSRKLIESIPIICRAYLQLPHERMDMYFEAIQPGGRLLTRALMIRLQFQPLLDRVEAFIEKEEWSKAHDLLMIILGSGGAELRYVQYLAAICELKLESRHIEEHGRFSGLPSSIAKTTARTCLEQMPDPEADPAKEAIRMFMQFMQGQSAGEQE